MPVAVLVIDRHAALQEAAEARRIERFCELRIVERLGLPEQEPSVAIGLRDQSGAGFGSEGEGAFEAFRLLKKGFERGFVEPVQHQNLRAGKQRGVQGEARVLGGRAHQCHHAPFHVGKEAVLLGAVEAVDLVHEQQGLAACLGHLFRLGEGLLQVRHARKHRADRGVAHPDTIGEQARDAGLAGAGRAPQDHAGELARRHHPPDRAFEAGQVLLPDHFGQCCRTQAIGQRRVGIGRGLRGRGCILSEQVSHSSSVIGSSAEKGTPAGETS